MKTVLTVLVMALGITALQAQTQDTTLQQYTGKYIFPAGSPFPEVSITLDNGVLSATSPAGSATLTKVDTDVFSIVEYGGTATFKRNEAGKVSSIQVRIADLDLTGTREPQPTLRDNYWHYYIWHPELSQERMWYFIQSNHLPSKAHTPAVLPAPLPGC